MNRKILALNHASIHKPAMSKTKLAVGVKIDGLWKAAIFICNITANK